MKLLRICQKIDESNNKFITFEPKNYTIFFRTITIITIYYKHLET